MLTFTKQWGLTKYYRFLYRKGFQLRLNASEPFESSQSITSMFSVKFLLLLLCTVAVCYQDYRNSTYTRGWKNMVQPLQMNNYINSRQSRCKEQINLICVIWIKMFWLFTVLSLFTFVQFNNQECITASGDNGTCLTPADCSQKGGRASGSCAAGFGSCCICK